MITIQLETWQVCLLSVMPLIVSAVVIAVDLWLGH